MKPCISLFGASRTEHIVLKELIREGFLEEGLRHA